MSDPRRWRYAGFWRRLAAFLIDAVLFNLLALLLLYLLYGWAYFQWAMRMGEQVGYYGPAEVLITWALPVLIAVFCWVRFRGTPGKLLLGCQVLDARSGARLRVGQALVRYLAYLVSALPLCLGFLWIAWDRRKQGFHDKIARTVVVMEEEAHKSLAELEEELR